MEHNNFSRREFLKAAALTAVGAGAMAAGAQVLTGAATTAAATLPPGKVVKVFGADAVAAGRINAAVADKMVNLAVMRLQDKREAAAAWKDLFSAKDVVGIKVNTQGGTLLSTSRAVVDAIVRALTGIGLPENKIIVWDGPDPKDFRLIFKPNTGPTGLRASTAADAGYEAPCALAPNRAAAFTKLLTRDITALINAPVLKTHGQTGVTFALKNIAMGGISRPSEHCGAKGNVVHQSIAAICAREEVRKKERLILGDALLGLFAGGPMPAPQQMWEPKCVAAARDPVAIDTWGLEAINVERKKRGLGPAGRRTRKGWDDAAHLRLAAELGVGANRFELVEETLG